MPPGATLMPMQAIEITLAFLFAGDVQAFLAEKPAFIQTMITLLGCVQPDCNVAINVAGGSVQVEVVVTDTATTSSVKTAAEAMSSKSTSELSTALGVAVEAVPTVSSKSVEVQKVVLAPSPPPLPSPPSPPPPPPPLPSLAPRLPPPRLSEGDEALSTATDADNQALVVGVVCGGMLLLLLCAVVLLHRCAPATWARLTQPSKGRTQKQLAVVAAVGTH